MRPLALVGPTASGKTEASGLIARALDAEIVSIDPALAYRGMDGWTGKPSAEFRTQVRHHLLDLVDPVVPVGVKDYQLRARQALRGIEARGRRALLVGASGLFFRAVVDDLQFPPTDRETRALLDAEALVAGPDLLYRRLADLDPAAAARIQPANARRTVRALEVAAVTGRPFSSFAAMWTRYDPRAVTVAGINVDRAALRRRIEARASSGFDDLLQETAALIDAGFGAFVCSGHLIGYGEAATCLDGRIDAEEAMALIARRDRALARRQLAWFRRDPRVRWFPAGDDGALGVVDQVVRYLRRGADVSTGSAHARMEG